MKLLSQHIFLGLPLHSGPCLLDLAVKNRKPDSLCELKEPNPLAER